MKETVLLSGYAFAASLVAASWYVPALGDQSSEIKYDIVITDGRIVDGTGSPWYVGDLGIRGGAIAKVGRIPPSAGVRHIDARGLIVAPGFVDMMGQTASPMLRDPTTAMNLLTQGITTINTGEGASAAPVNEHHARSLGWRTMSEYFQVLDLKGLPVNLVQTVGHSQVRQLVLGEDNRRPSALELEQMESLVHEAMQAGAIGLSTALIYPPAVYATTEEIAALASVAGEYGGKYFTHMRNEGDQLLEAIDEALEIGRKAETPVHIFHLKAAGRQNWGKMQLAIARIKTARAEGRQVTADIYPYINNGLGIAALIHPRHFGTGRANFVRRLRDNRQLREEVREEMESTAGWENWYRHAGSDWDKILIGQTNEERYANHVGSSVATIAEAVGEDPWTTFFNLVRAGAFALPETMSDANKILAIQQEFVSFCTDVGPAGGGQSATHPRAFGSFPRLLARYIRDLGAISLERAVAQASAAAANNVMIHDRGRIAEGLAADIIVFDYDKLIDTATFARPHDVSQGIQHVLVNGEVVLSNGRYTGSRPGRVLRGPGYDKRRGAHAISTGKSIPSFQAVDHIVQDFIKKHGVPGASLAISDGGRLVHARGYGYADVAAGQPITPRSRFRIASVSKPITAAAILQLVDLGKLSLDDPVFHILNHSPHLQDGAELDPRQSEITIQHLLQHRGGWDRDLSFDPMFRSVHFAQLLQESPPATADMVIQVMRGKRLDFDPGDRYAYSNYGYCLLGRVIEALTERTYEQYVVENVLTPLGITSMQIGATLPEERAEGEVRYYDPNFGPSVFGDSLGSEVPSAYGAWHLEAMDSHGAWIASASDLVRFACAFDQPKQCHILSADSVRQMFQRPDGAAGFDDQGQPKPTYYGLGWTIVMHDDGRFTASHSGSLPGTNTRLIRRPDGRNVAILFNARVSPYTSRVINALLPQLSEAIDRVAPWPKHDLFRGSEKR